MGTLFSALEIARSGLKTAQVQLDTAGHNIANANKPGFSRQRVEILSQFPLNRAFGQIGRGVKVARIERLRDEFLDVLFRRQVQGLANAEIRAEFFTRIENVFLEPGEQGLSRRINAFFDALGDFSVNVESLPVRESVLTEARVLVDLFRETAEQLRLLRNDANDEIINFVPIINGLASRIASLNERIAEVELGGQTANDLRDDRDLLLDELAGIVTIFTRERDNGEIDVLVSGQVLVDGRTSRQLEAVRVPELDIERNDLVEVRFVESGIAFTTEGGAMAGALDIRDRVIVDIDARIDTIARTVIDEINAIQRVGRGLRPFTGATTGTAPVTGSNIPLGSAGIPLNILQGSVDMVIVDSSGNIVDIGTITLDATTTTLDDIASQIDALTGISATTAQGFLDITPDPNFGFTFTNVQIQTAPIPGTPPTTTDPLGNSGLPVVITSTTFDVVVADPSGNVLATQSVAIDASVTSLDDLAAQLDAVPGVTASTNGGFLEMEVNPSFTLTLTNVVTGILPPGTVPSTNTSAPIGSGGIPINVVQGSVDIVVLDGAGNPVDMGTIALDGPTTSLDDIANQINALTGISATTTGGLLDVSIDPNFGVILDNIQVQSAAAPAPPASSPANPTPTNNPLGSGGVSVVIASSSFDVTVTDPSGNVVTVVPIVIDSSVTTLDDVATQINAIPNVTATLNNGFLDLTVDPAFSFSVGNIQADIIAPLGGNTVFTGTDARTIGLSSVIVNDPGLLASAFSLDPLDTGDNRAALAMADVREGLFLQNGSTDINQFYESTIVQIGIDARANNQDLEVEQTFVRTFEQRRLEVSGVSIDEEVTSLLLFQRAFEASARVVTVTDRMLDALMAMAR